MARRGKTRKAKPQKSPEQIRREEIAGKALAIGVGPDRLRHGDYDLTEANRVEGFEITTHKTLINRGGSTVDRWLNAANDDQIGDAEKAAIRYCQSLWQRIDRRGPRLVRVDCDDSDPVHEALTELSQIKGRFVPRHWKIYEDICRFELASATRHSKVAVGFVAGMIAMWRGL